MIQKKFTRSMPSCAPSGASSKSAAEARCGAGLVGLQTLSTAGQFTLNVDLAPPVRDLCVHSSQESCKIKYLRFSVNDFMRESGLEDSRPGSCHAIVPHGDLQGLIVSGGSSFTSVPQA